MILFETPIRSSSLMLLWLLANVHIIDSLNTQGTGILFAISLQRNPRSCSSECAFPSKKLNKGGKSE